MGIRKIVTTKDSAMNNTHMPRSRAWVFFSRFILICFAIRSTENEELADNTNADSVDILAESNNTSTTAIKISGTMEVSISIVVMILTLGFSASGPRITRPIAPQKYAPQPMSSANIVEI